MPPAWHQKAARQKVFYAQIAQQHHNEDLSEGNLPKRSKPTTPRRGSTVRF